MITIEILGKPIPCMRPRFMRIGNFVRTYDPQDKLKQKWKWQIRSQYPEEPLKQALIVIVLFFMPVPKGTSKIKKAQMINGDIYHMHKPDIDNLTKFILDCLNKIVYLDDAQIVRITAKKAYSDIPGTFIRIKTIDEEKMDEINATLP